MKKSRFTDSQIMGVLKQAASGISVPDLCREHGISGLSPQGPVMLESNANFDLMFLQRVMGKSLTHTRFGEVMNYQLKQFCYHKLPAAPS